MWVRKPGSLRAPQPRDPVTKADSRTPEITDLTTKIFTLEERDANTCHPAPGRLGKGVRAAQGPGLLGSAVQRRRLFCAASEMSVGGNADRGRGPVLPPEVSDRNQPCGRGESRPGDPVSGRLSPSNTQSPSRSLRGRSSPAAPVSQLKGIRRKVELGSASAGHSPRPSGEERVVSIVTRQLTSL